MIKTLVAGFCFICLFAASVVLATSFSSYEKIADAQIVARGGELCSVLVITDGTNDATLALYDVAAAASIAASNKLAEIKVSGEDFYGGRICSDCVQFTNGLYGDVTGTDASYIIEWKNR